MDRFWSKVDKTPGLGPGGECWLWTAAKHTAGYGKFSWGHSNWIHAHRHSWVMANGDIPDGMFVCHKCDTPSCVRPDHLFLGTHSQNMQDMHAKGRNYHVTKPCRIPRGANSGPSRMPWRMTRGERASQSKLTEDVVRQIRLVYANDDVSQREIAERFGVSQVAVSCVIRRKTWGHVT